ncbi:MAG TPA: sigma-70 family RNA polymerase sigma factor, partial [Streptosporangiaceae bacterium]|nr:sigma-70 family RNA polymerase sigma factor [Streptosporangiaceae bacterium]
MQRPACGQAGRGQPGRADAAVAVTELFRAHHLELVRIALVMVGDIGTAEDVVQDAFERLHRRWRGLRDEASALAYARSSVLNGCRSVHRRSAVARKYAGRLAQVPGAAPPAGGDAAQESADRSVLIAALRQLPRRQREVLVLRYYADLEVGEVARTLGIGLSAVRSTATRGLAALAGGVPRHGTAGQRAVYPAARTARGLERGLVAPARLRSGTGACCGAGRLPCLMRGLGCLGR